MFTDENGIICSKSRLSDANLKYNIKKLILLLPTNYFTKVVILKAHEEVLYAGTEITLNEIRNKYRVLSGRQTVRKVIKSCAICKQFQGKASLPSPSPALPDYRVCSDFVRI